MKKLIISFWLLCCLIYADAWAFDPANLYQATLPVSSASRADFQKVLPQALLQVLLKVSGDETVANNTQIQAQLNQANSLVQSFSYSQNEQNQNFLQVNFNKEGINQFLRSAKVAVLPENRPLTLLWIVAQSKEGQSVLHDSSNSLVASIQTTADQRGIPILWPDMDLQDVTALPLDKINSFDVNAITAASQRYQPDNILVGILTQSVTGQWQGKWMLISQGSNNQWQTQTPNISQTISPIFNRLLVANRLGITPTAGGSIEIVKLKINGVGGLDDYANVLKYLRGLNVVSDVSAKQVDPNSLTLELKVQGGQAALAQALDQGRKLIPEQPNMGENNTTNTAAQNPSSPTLFYHWQSADSQPTLSLQPMPVPAQTSVDSQNQDLQGNNDEVLSYPTNTSTSDNTVDLGTEQPKIIDSSSASDRVNP